MKRAFKFIVIAAAICSLCAGDSIAQQSQPTEDITAKYREAAIKKWEKHIADLEKLDATEQHPDNAILFIGSSSIRRWDSIAADMSPWPTIRRGYGGARFSDLAVFVDRLITPHKYEALVIFVGNDIAGKDIDKKPQEVLDLFKYVVSRSRKHLPETPIFFIQITPTSSRFDVWGEVEKMHALVKKYVASESDLHFIETAPKYLKKDGKPNDDLFVKDRLHLNEAGYRLWASIIKQSLEGVLKQK